jgi:hypothetical protein
VFDAIIVNATRLCDAQFGILTLNENNRFPVVAMHDVPPAYAEWLRKRVSDVLIRKPWSGASPARNGWCRLPMFGRPSLKAIRFVTPTSWRVLNAEPSAPLFGALYRRATTDPQLLEEAVHMRIIDASCTENGSDDGDGSPEGKLSTR